VDKKEISRQKNENGVGSDSMTRRTPLAKNETSDNKEMTTVSPVEELEKIRQRLAELERDQKLGLVWRDIPEDVETRLRDEIPVLIHEKELDVPGAAPSDQAHILIEGDNLHALHVLQATHRGKVDVIYIDPPYNTGDSDWKYNNKFVSSDDPYFHSQWLSFMDKRLNLAKELLSENGVMIVTIDEHEVHRLALLLERYFPADRIQMVTIVINGAGSSRGYFSRVEEHAFFIFLGDAKPAAQEDDLLSIARTSTPSVPWDSLIRTGPGSLREDRPNMFYPVYVNKQTGKIVGVGEPIPLTGKKPVKNPHPDSLAVWPTTSDGKDARWRIGADSLGKLVQSGYARARVSGSEASITYLKKKQLSDIESGRIKVLAREKSTGVAQLEYVSAPLREVKTVWNRPTHNAGANGTQLVKKLIGSRDFPFPKSLYAVEDTLRLVARPDALVLDFFAGSGTTAHAVASLNAQDGGRRRSILVTNNENGICREVTHRRIKAFLTGAWADGDHEPLPGSLVFYRTDFANRLKSPDRMRTEIAKHTVDLVAVMEATTRTLARNATIALLKGSGTTVAVVPGLDPDHAELHKTAEKKVEEGDKKVVYLFTWSDNGVEEEIAALWPGWEVNPLPAEMLAALRRVAPPARLFEDLGGES